VSGASLLQRLRLTDVELELRELARDFMTRRVEPITAELESRPADHLPALFEEMGELGLLGPFFPEEYGGLGARLHTRAVIAEETARVNAGLDASMFADIILCARAIFKHGSEEQRRRYLVPLLRGEFLGSMAITEPSGGSNALSPKTRATKEGSSWVIQGSKTFITNAPIARCILVLARTSGQDREIEGGTWFIVEAGTEGLEIGPPFEKTGWKSSLTSEVFLNSVVVDEAQVLGEVGKGFHYLVDALDVERMLVGASTVGIAQAALEEMVSYASTREVFGEPIARFQLIQEKIANTAAAIELSRTYLYSLLDAAEAGHKITREASVLKLYSSSMASQAASDAVQVLGGYGYMADARAARCYRDAKYHEIGAGTNEIQKVIIARETLRHAGVAIKPGRSQ
jgi:alkylation response protein AidB-like acyl-CoA dehydrogenase